MATLVRRFLVDNVSCVDVSGGNAKTLAMTGATIRMDASWAPYIQVTLTGNPPAQADLDAINPRAGWRANFRVRAFDGAGTQLQSWSLNLGIRDRRRLYTTGQPTFALTLASDEALLQDYFMGATETYSGGTAPTIGARRWAEAVANIAGKPIVWLGGFSDVDVPSADAGWTADQNAWDYIATMAEAAGTRVYCEEDGRLLWVLPTYTPDTTTRAIVGIIDVDDVVSRDAPDWANFAVVTYTGNSPAQVVTSDSGLSPRKGIGVTRNRRKPGTGNAATKIRTTAQARGRNLSITAVADLALRPMQQRTATYQGQTWTGTVQSVQFDLPAGTMAVVLNVIEP